MTFNLESHLKFFRAHCLDAITTKNRFFGKLWENITFISQFHLSNYSWSWNHSISQCLTWLGITREEMSQGRSTTCLEFSQREKRIKKWREEIFKPAQKNENECRGTRKTCITIHSVLRQAQTNGLITFSFKLYYNQ